MVGSATDTENNGMDNAIDHTTSEPSGIAQNLLASFRGGIEPIAEPIIKVTGLEKHYGVEHPVLKGIDLTITAGETVALIGSNGAGKSTLLKCMVGLHENSKGSVHILGETFERNLSGNQRRKVRSQIGFVFQSHGLVKRLSAHSNVIHGFLGQKGSWRAFSQMIAPQPWRLDAMKALDAVQLAHKAKDRADALSGGQAQRVAIARALVRQPKILIADEPAASLDPASGHAVMQQFVDLAQQNNITLIFTSHDMQHALAYSDRVIALKNGRIFIDAASRSLCEADLQGVFEND